MWTCVTTVASCSCLNSKLQKLWPDPSPGRKKVLSATSIPARPHNLGPSHKNAHLWQKYIESVTGQARCQLKQRAFLSFPANQGKHEIGWCLRNCRPSQYVLRELTWLIARSYDTPSTWRQAWSRGMFKSNCRFTTMDWPKRSDYLQGIWYILPLIPTQHQLHSVI